MTTEQTTTSDQAVSELQAEIKRTYDAISDAWNSVAALQEHMREAGVPHAIVGMLDDTRKSVSDTSIFPALVEVIGWKEGGA